MAHLGLTAAETADIRSVWSRLPGMGAAWLELSDAIYTRSRLPARVRECARRRIAEINGCQLCLAVRFPGMDAEGVDEAMYEHVVEYATWPGYSPEERLAIEFAERFALDHLAMDDAFWLRMRDTFSDDEIADLGVSVATWLAQGRLTQVLGLDVACELTRAGEDGVVAAPQD